MSAHGFSAILTSQLVQWARVQADLMMRPCWSTSQQIWRGPNGFLAREGAFGILFPQNESPESFRFLPI